MKRKFIKLMSAATAVTTVITSNLVGVYAEENNQSTFAVQEEKKAKDNETVGLELKTNITTGAGATVTTGGEATVSTDIPSNVYVKYEQYFKDNSLNNISDIINVVYENLNNIDLKSNPDFLDLEKCKKEYFILNEILQEGNIDFNKEMDIRQVVTIYDEYDQLSQEDGYIYRCNANDTDNQIAYAVRDFLTEYNYNNATIEKVENDLLKFISEKYNDSFTIDDEGYSNLIALPTNASSGYISMSALIQKDNFKIIEFSFEKVIKKLPIINNPSSGSSSSGSGSSSSGSSSSGSGSSSSSNDEPTINNTSTGDTIQKNETVKLVTEENTIKLVDQNGQALTGWQQINGQWYLGDLNGQALTGWQQVNGEWYFLKQTGEMQTGWYQDTDGKWYILQKSGAMYKGWYRDTNGLWYYLKQSGEMSKGWYRDTNGKWYYLDNSGAMVTGWHQDSDGSWYYLKEDGSMATDEYIDGYYLNSNGAWS